LPGSLHPRLIRYRLLQRLRRAGIQAATPDPYREVLVYQPGKVASTAIVEGLVQHGVAAVQTHFLDPASLRDATDRICRQPLSPADTAAALGQLNSNLLLSRAVHTALRAPPAHGKERIRVLTLCRDPLDWYFSNLAQNFARTEPKLREWLRTQGWNHPAPVEAQHLLRFLEQLAQIFIAVSAELARSSDAPLAARLRPAVAKATSGQPALFRSEVSRLLQPAVWFQRHLEPVFGVDVYQLPFDQSAGFAEHIDERLHLLLVRFEDLSQNLDRIAALAGLGTLQLRRRNRSDSKPVASPLALARRGFQPPRAFLQQLYGTRFAQTFYPHANSRHPGSMISA
jgi:hypothetical protein